MQLHADRGRGGVASTWSWYHLFLQIWAWHAMQKDAIFFGGNLQLIWGTSAQTPRSRRNLEGQQSELLDFVGSILLCLCPSAWEPSCCAYWIWCRRAESGRWFEGSIFLEPWWQCCASGFVVSRATAWCIHSQCRSCFLFFAAIVWIEQF